MLVVNLFNWIVCSSAMAAFLVCFVLTVKTFLGNKLEARWHHLIWLLVLLKLLVPFGPESQFSLFNTINLTDKNITESSYQVVNTINATTNNLIQSTPFPVPNFAPPPLETSYSAASALQRASHLSMFGIVVWLIGALSTGLFIFRRQNSFRKILKEGRRIKEKELQYSLNEYKKMLGINRNIILREVIFLRTPALYGIIKPTLLIPSNLINNSNTELLKHAILHELMHLKRRDILIHFIFSIFVIIHWFNPLIWFAFYKLRQDTEVACDADVLSYLDTSQRKSYGLTLLNFIEKVAKIPEQIHAVRFLSNKTLIKKRINRIILYRERSIGFSALMIAAFSLLCISILTNAVNI